jgi:hypothetical protein
MMMMTTKNCKSGKRWDENSLVVVDTKWQRRERDENFHSFSLLFINIIHTTWWWLYYKKKE